MSTMYKMACAFMDGFRNVRSGECKKDKAIRDSLSEHQIDTMVSDSFPASDPPSTY